MACRHGWVLTPDAPVCPEGCIGVDESLPEMELVEVFKKSLARQMLGMTLDETPGGVNSDAIALAQERGRREGWNMLIRHMVRALEG